MQGIDTSALDAIPPTVRVTNLGAKGFARCSREHILNQLAAILSGGSPALVEDDAVASLLPLRPSERLDQVLAAGVKGFEGLSESPSSMQSRGARDVLAERERQIDEEGWTPEHDDQHTDGSIARAAGCYALHASGLPEQHARHFWPWEWKWWKPSPQDARRMLVKAAALIIAEIDRLDRAAEKGGSS
jgi:hypothetical protein